MKIRWENLSKAEADLAKKLFKIWDDAEFVVGVIACLQDDSERQDVIEYIESNKGVTSEEVTLLALHIGKEREKHQTILDDFFTDLREIEKELQKY